MVDGMTDCLVVQLRGLNAVAIWVWSWVQDFRVQVELAPKVSVGNQIAGLLPGVFMVMRMRSQRGSPADGGPW